MQGDQLMLRCATAGAMPDRERDSLAAFARPAAEVKGRQAFPESST